ncbi:MAG: hypothetical protein A2928_00215 [Candidatus Taylorbacteria bacterium RIFCSPLOWO2_01_FULL_45_15b]|uniref:GIY-YIG domain-containing protein n=1 Tax=Candidatus Taylorbacteria bacterium RIFCSPLOWO2_01_FULL_45_15b TaxID=1802319 RepID=A0A1G2N9G8_9BACT|nr:MAG: hypothetical protein A2928_00215 [Candidatus Taylorbacteria bacterium RIFCSPLOWO2_01_FULL_45_15b]
MGYVYILKDENHQFYIGSTINVENRFKAHLNKQTQTTSRMRDIKLVLKQEYPNIQIARLIERRLKKMKRKDYIEKIIEDGYIKMAY